MKYASRLIIAGLLGFIAISAAAKADLVSDGGFDTLSAGGGELGYNTDAAGWTSTGFFFAFQPGIADTTGITASYGNIALWGPNNGAANGLPTTSPAGGNFIASDAAFGAGALSQTITGLTVGAQYDVGFWWAGAEQYGYGGDNTEQWLVALGNQQLDTTIVTNSAEGFSGWAYTTLRFTADGTSDVLSFMSSGGPSGVPPFALLDDVTMTAVPEPASAAVFAAGLAMLGIAAWRGRLRRAKRASG